MRAVRNLGPDRGSSLAKFKHCSPLWFPACTPTVPLSHGELLAEAAKAATILLGGKLTVQADSAVGAKTQEYLLWYTSGGLAHCMYRIVRAAARVFGVEGGGGP